MELLTRGACDYKPTHLTTSSFLYPPLEEQKRIAAYLDERCVAIDEAISRQEQLIEKLGEYRKSVIHHAVTGKIDCTEHSHDKSRHRQCI